MYEQNTDVLIIITTVITASRLFLFYEILLCYFLFLILKSKYTLVVYL